MQVTLEGEDFVVSVVASGVAWLLSRLVGQLADKRQQQAVRYYLPTIALAVALVFVSIWNELQGAGAITGRTVLQAVLAGLGALFSHSQLRGIAKHRAQNTFSSASQQEQEQEGPQQ